jgi:hypothetical protein
MLVRFADDAIILCAHERDAKRVIAVLPKRFGKYGLNLHSNKTHVSRFQRPLYHPKGTWQVDASALGPFDLLGFTHYWGRSRQGTWVVRRKTDSKRLTRVLKQINPRWGFPRVMLEVA